MSYIQTVEKLKKVKCDKSPWIYSWNEHIDKNRPHIFYSKNSRLISAMSKELKDGFFYAYKFTDDFIKHRSNISSLYTLENFEQQSLIKNPKFGMIVLDTISSINTKNVLNIFDKFIDNKTIIFCPYIVNFENYENRVIDGVMNYCKQKGYELKWLAHIGDVQLYDIKDIGYNQGATFKFVKKI